MWPPESLPPSEFMSLLGGPDANHRARLDAQRVLTRVHEVRIKERRQYVDSAETLVSALQGTALGVPDEVRAYRSFEADVDRVVAVAWRRGRAFVAGGAGAGLQRVLLVTGTRLVPVRSWEDVVTVEASGAISGSLPDYLIPGAEVEQADYAAYAAAGTIYLDGSPPGDRFALLLAVRHPAGETIRVLAETLPHGSGAHQRLWQVATLCDTLGLYPDTFAAVASHADLMALIDLAERVSRRAPPLQH